MKLLMEDEKMKIGEVINWNAVDFDLEAADKAEALEKVCEMLYRDGSITSAEEFIRDVYLRESEGHTGIGGGIAIPHGKSEVVARTCISIARLKKPIAWETVDGEPVRVIILFAVGVRDKNSYFVKLMSQVARMLARPGVCEQLTMCTSQQKLSEILGG